MKEVQPWWWWMLLQYLALGYAMGILLVGALISVLMGRYW